MNYNQYQQASVSGLDFAMKTYELQTSQEFNDQLAKHLENARIELDVAIKKHDIAKAALAKLSSGIPIPVVITSFPTSALNRPNDQISMPFGG